MRRHRNRPLAVVAATAAALIMMSACEPPGPALLRNRAGVEIPKKDLGKASTSMKLAPLFSMVKGSDATLRHAYGTARRTGDWRSDYSTGENQKPADGTADSCATIDGKTVRTTPDGPAPSAPDLPDPAPCTDGLAGYLFTDSSTGSAIPTETEQVIGPDGALTNYEMELTPLYELTNGTEDEIYRYATTKTLEAPVYGTPENPTAPLAPDWANSCPQRTEPEPETEPETIEFGEGASGGTATLVGWGFSTDQAQEIPNVRVLREYVRPSTSGSAGDAYYASDAAGAAWAAANGYCEVPGPGVIGLRQQAPFLQPVYGLFKDESAGRVHRYTTKISERDVLQDTEGWTMDTLGTCSTVTGHAEGIVGYVWDQPVPGTVPVFWLRRGWTDENEDLHLTDESLYTSDVTIASNLSHFGYISSGVLGYAYASAQPGTTLLHQYTRHTAEVHDGYLATCTDSNWATPTTESGYVLDGNGPTAHVMTELSPPVPYFEISPPHSDQRAIGLDENDPTTPKMIVIHGGGFDAGWHTWDGAPTWMADEALPLQLVQRWNARGWETYNVEYQKGLENSSVALRRFAQQLRDIAGQQNAGSTTICATGQSAGAVLSFLLASDGPGGPGLQGPMVDCAIALSAATQSSYLKASNYTTLDEFTPQHYASTISVPVMAAAGNGEMWMNGNPTQEVNSAGVWAYATQWEEGDAHKEVPSVVSTCAPKPFPHDGVNQSSPADAKADAPDPTDGPPMLMLLCLDSSGKVHNSVTSPSPNYHNPGNTQFVHDNVFVAPQPGENGLLGPISFNTYLTAEWEFAAQVLWKAAHP